MPTYTFIPSGGRAAPVSHEAPSFDALTVGLPPQAICPDIPDGAIIDKALFLPTKDGAATLTISARESSTALPVTWTLRVVGLADDERVPTILVWETIPDGFDPLTDTPKTPGGQMGLLVALAKELTRQEDGEADPLDIPWDNPAKCVAKTLTTTLGCRPPRNKTTDAILSHMEKLGFALLDVEAIPQEDREQAALVYYLAKNYFYHAHQITALEHYRTKMGLTFAQLADLAGVSDRQIRYYEQTPYSTLSSAKHAVVCDLAAALDVSPDTLVSGWKTRMMMPETH